MFSEQIRISFVLFSAQIIITMLWFYFLNVVLKLKKNPFCFGKIEPRVFSYSSTTEYAHSLPLSLPLSLTHYLSHSRSLSLSLSFSLTSYFFATYPCFFLSFFLSLAHHLHTQSMVKVWAEKMLRHKKGKKRKWKVRNGFVTKLHNLMLDPFCSQQLIYF